MMKKQYEKPTIIFENFSLSTRIAGNCGIVIDNQSSGTCGLDFGDEMIFLTGISSCGPDPLEADDGLYNGICYHNPTDAMSLFNS